MEKLLAVTVLLIASLIHDSEERCHRTCIDGWTRYGNRCYKFFNTKMTWDNAEIACSNATKDGHLTSITTEAENNFMVELVKAVDQSVPPVWTGGNDLAKKYTWAWVDGTSFSYANWNPGEPNNSGSEDCIQMNWGNPGGWNDKKCREVYPFICRY
ncbi:lectin-like [Protopterus annectens]|uniref:lectin-like n=1 Tax=Protopterus annectens TaxID=7888 RepID=UPI001CFA4307|nr:lectin-like [Protopterus annectens]